MKIKLLPILSIAAALFFTSNLSAQRSIDWSVEEIQIPPTKITARADGTASDITVRIIVKNNGPDTAKVGDSIFYRFQIPLSQTQAILIPGQTTSNFLAVVLTKDLVPNDSILQDTVMITWTGSTNLIPTNLSFNVNLTAVSQLFNRSAGQVAIEDNSTLTNNVLSSSVEWINRNGFGVNVTTVDAGNMFSIYPNPSTSGVFTINSMFKNATDTENQINVMDINGRVVFSTSLNNFNNEQTLDLSGLTNGIYFVEYSVGEFKSTQKVSITK